MKQLQLYRKLGISSEEELTEYFTNEVTGAIATWDYYTDFNKSIKHASMFDDIYADLLKVRKSNNSESKFIDFCRKSSLHLEVVFMLIAIREGKLKNLSVVEDEDSLDTIDGSVFLDNPSDEQLKKLYLNSGMDILFSDLGVESFRDLVLGIEIGMDTHARKNRTGNLMENLVIEIIKEDLSSMGLKYVLQATSKKVKDRWGLKLPRNNKNTKVDLVIGDVQSGKMVAIEVNYYNEAGSKQGSVSQQFRDKDSFYAEHEIPFIWITDGNGISTIKNDLLDTINSIDYVFNLQLVRKGALTEVLKSFFDK